MEGIKNPINVTIPTARISDCLLNPGASYDFNGKRSQFPDIRLVYWAGGNPFHHHQDTNKLRRAFARPETIVVHEPWWTATARHADIVLPATTSLERNDIGGARRDNFIIAMHRAIAPVGEARDDFAIFSALAERLGFAETYTEGRDEDAWLRHLYEQCRHSAGANAAAVPDFDTFWEQGYLEIPAVTDEYVLFADFRADPDKHKLKTPSGKIELYLGEDRGLRLRRLPAASDLDRAVGMARRPRRQNLSAASRARASRATGCTARWTAGRSAPAARSRAARRSRSIRTDAKARGISDGDVVRVHNARGSCLAGAIVSDTVSAGVSEALLRRLVRSGRRRSARCASTAMPMC